MEKNKGSVLMQRYELGRLLGQGSFAKVYYGKNVRSSETVAIKVIDKEKVMRVGLVDQIKREISVMRLVRHPNIVRLYEVMATKTKIYFVMEYAKGGELFEKIAKGRLKEDMARKYFQQLINAVDFCHSRGVYHRDLKPENLLLDENESLKVSDFGLSTVSESKDEDELLHTTCGTPAYVAPEVISRKGYYGAKADIWSCGVILYVLLAGYLPFHDSNLMEMYRKISRAEFKCPNWFPSEARKLVAKILDPNPATRISIVKIKENHWFRGKQHPMIRSKVSNTSDCSSSSSSNNYSEEIGVMNAFDIILSFSDGFNLSRLFEDKEVRNVREAKFTSAKSVSVIMSKLEEMGKCLKMKVEKKGRGVLRLDVVMEGKKGVLSIDAQIFELTSCFFLVEVNKSNGDTLEYQKILKEDIRPALSDIVYAWQG